MKTYITGAFAFVPTDRTKSGATLYVKVDACIGLVVCSDCGAEVGELCKGETGLTVGTHHVRRKVGATIRRAIPDKVHFFKTPLVVE